MNLSTIFKSKICWIISVLIGIGIIVGLAGLTYYLTSSPNAVDDILLVKTTSQIQVFNLKDNKSNVIVEEDIYGIVGLDVYPGKTVFYSTTKPDEGISSSNKETYPDITEIAKNWSKSALAVDYLNDKIYVLDSVDNLIYAIDINGKAYKTIRNDLNDPIDMVIDPYQRFLFVLQESSIIKINVDGSIGVEVVKMSNLKAMTIDKSSTSLFYSNPESVESFNYQTNTKTLVMSRNLDISSLAVTNNYLYFIEVSNSGLVHTLTSCQLTKGICVGELETMYNDNTMQSLKVFEKEKHSIDNNVYTKNNAESVYL